MTNTLQMQFLLLFVLYRKVCPVGPIVHVFDCGLQRFQQDEKPTITRMTALFQFSKKGAEVVCGKNGHGWPASERGYSSNLAKVCLNQSVSVPDGKP